ncbi:MAG: AtpZ/AtpI family protein [Candidatus Binatia bacterium]
MGYLTSLGWLIAIPIGVSVVLGRYLDNRVGSQRFWTLTLLSIGIGFAMIEVYLAGRYILRKKNQK